MDGEGDDCITYTYIHYKQEKSNKGFLLNEDTE